MMDIIDINEEELVVYQWDSPLDMHVRKRVIILDASTFQEKEHIDIENLRGHKCDIFSVSASATEVQLLQRCRRKGGVKIVKTTYSRQKQEKVKEEDVAVIGDAEGRWEGNRTLINNDSLMLYLEVDDTKKTQTDHYFLFDKTNQYELISKAVIERNDRRKNRETILDYAISRNNGIAYLQASQLNSTEKISLQAVVLEGSKTQHINLPGDQLKFVSGRIDYLRNGDLVVSLAESESRDESVDRIRLLQGNLTDGITRERLIDLPSLKGGDSRKLTKDFALYGITEMDRYIMLRGAQIKIDDIDNPPPIYKMKMSILWSLDKEFKTLASEVIYLNSKDAAFPEYIMPSAFYNYESSDFIVFHNVDPSKSRDNFRSLGEKTKMPSKNCALMSWYFSPDGEVINRQYGEPTRHNVEMATLTYFNGYIYMISYRHKGLKPRYYLGKVPIAYAFWWPYNFTILSLVACYELDQNQQCVTRIVNT